MLIDDGTQVYNSYTLANRNGIEFELGKKCMIETLWGKMKISAPGGKNE